jgi:3-oxoacyl-[acyl-carrier protein] reductase
MDFNFSGKSVLITGSSKGIGYATAQLFAEHGATVAINYNRDNHKAEKNFKALNGSGHILVQADLANPESVQRLIDQTVEAFDRIDILVNNAGVYNEHSVSDVDYDEWQDVWQRTLSVNLLGPAYVSFCAVKHMLRAGGGKIVNISSRGAFRGEPNAPAYGASKAGLNAMSQSMAKALAPQNIFVYVVAPGFVETDMATPLLEGPDGEAIRHQSPLGRAAKPEEIARTIAFLSSEGSDYLTGGIIDVNGASYLRS